MDSLDSLDGLSHAGCGERREKRVSSTFVIPEAALERGCPEPKNTGGADRSRTFVFMGSGLALARAPE